MIMRNSCPRDQAEAQATIGATGGKTKIRQVLIELLNVHERRLETLRIELTIDSQQYADHTFTHDMSMVSCSTFSFLAR